MRVSLPISLVALLPWCAVLASPTSAQEDAIARARTMIENFEYREAAAVLQDSITRAASPADELLARSLLVVAWASAGDDASAQRAAAALYERDPGFELPNSDELAPRIRTVFADARLAAQAAPPVEVRHEERKTADALSISLTVPTPAILAEARVRLRVAPAAAWSPADDVSREGTVFSLLVPLPERLEGVSIDYYAEFVTPSGHVVGRVGSEAAPITWAPEPTRRGWWHEGDRPPEEPSSVNWWIVGGVGAAVLAAAGVGAYFLLRPEQPTLDLELQTP